MNLILPRLGVGLIFGFGLGGCVSMSAQFAPARTGQSYVSRTPTEKVELFRSQTPTRKYQEIGAVNACCNLDSTTMIEMLRRKASESGGDALIGLEINATGGASASVIRFEEL